MEGGVKSQGSISSDVSVAGPCVNRAASPTAQAEGFASPGLRAARFAPPGVPAADGGTMHKKRAPSPSLQRSGQARVRRQGWGAGFGQQPRGLGLCLHGAAAPRSVALGQVRRGTLQGPSAR